MARLAAASGLLRDDGLVCSSCTPDLRSARGCGEPAWDPSEIIEEAGAGAWDDDALLGEAADRYEHAGACGIWQAMRRLWDRCPAWYAERSDPDLRVAADIAICYAGCAADGISISPSPVLTSTGLEIVRLVVSIRAALTQLRSRPPAVIWPQDTGG